MIIFGKGCREKIWKKCLQTAQGIHWSTCMCLLSHSMWNTFVPLSEGPYSSMHLNWQFEIHPGELENSSQCLARERMTPTTCSTGLQKVLAPEMVLKEIFFFIYGLIQCSNNSSYFFAERLPSTKGDAAKSLVCNMAAYLEMESHSESVVSQWTWTEVAMNNLIEVIKIFG